MALFFLAGRGRFWSCGVGGGGGSAVWFCCGGLAALGTGGFFHQHEGYFFEVSRVDATEAVEEFPSASNEVFVFFQIVPDVDFFAVVDYPLVELVAEKWDAGAVVDGKEEGRGCGADAFEGHKGCNGFCGGEGVGFVGCEGFQGDVLDCSWGVGLCEFEEVGAEGPVLSGCVDVLV